MTKRKAALVYTGLACLSDKSDCSRPSAALNNDTATRSDPALIAWAMCWDHRDPAPLSPAGKHVEPFPGDLFKDIALID